MYVCRRVYVSRPPYVRVPINTHTNTQRLPVQSARQYADLPVEMMVEQSNLTMFCVSSFTSLKPDIQKISIQNIRHFLV